MFRESCFYETMNLEVNDVKKKDKYFMEAHLGHLKSTA